MITLKQMATIIELLYNDMDKTSTDCTLGLYTEVKKFYQNYTSYPNNVNGTMIEVASAPIGVDGVESVETTYNIDFVVPEKYLVANRNILKSLQMEYQGRLVDLSDSLFSSLGLSNYTLKIGFESYIEGEMEVLPNGNVRRCSIMVRASINNNILLGGKHTFTLTVGQTTYALPYTRFEIGDSKNLRAGNWDTNGRIGSIVQSQNLSITLYVVAKDNAFMSNVIIPCVFENSPNTATLNVSISVNSTTKTYAIPVIINVLSYSGTHLDGIIVGINFMYRG